MEPLTNNALLMMQRSMDFLWTKQTAILDNIANVETPNYKAKYVTFEETLRGKLDAVGNGKAQDFRDVLEDSSATVHVAENETARMDGNGVDMTEQAIELARNALQQQHVFNAISNDLTLLRTAIRGQ
ncbi:flagellar basal body rod protein FlgB [Intestinibacillus sp. Marseille-P6563]|uniref:flagellar basal body rod protein FlgB n=1 Tax=Intestinibacillus sp. Marseille-P6563 TaxID=2364792 RepID=UPI000F06ECA1|nr:flagellar basal body rod protein FlgB [Intestinibacillus sp. Marseille-P6563]